MMPGMVRQAVPQVQPPHMMPPLIMVPPPGQQPRPQMMPPPAPLPPPPPHYQDPPAPLPPREGAPQYSRQESAEDVPEGAAAPYPPQARPPRRHTGTLRISKWVNPIPPDPDDGQQQVGEQELATKMLQIQSKRFYIDVKQNRRGRFMKVAEIGADGRRNQVFLALSTAAEFRDHLSLFSDFYANLVPRSGPPNPDTLPEDGKLKSETMVKDNRRYYLDLKENSRGRFLRVSCVSQTIARGGPRCQIAIPAQGMIEFRDALQELLDEFGTDDGGYKGELPEGRHMRVENKNFYFDIGQNNRGIYMRISEVKTNFRTAITIPEKSWSRFRDIFADYVDKMKDGGEKGPSESNK
ncbi:transcriptional activator protein Pur-beta-like isoform X1 [Scylla paramamosain]|uniref:transcriptional activator protein Pur-beta-like isoform X1 n=1 Tax=Scylla paramamosain TaxID=85552 RepID=UPI003082C44A